MLCSFAVLAAIAVAVVAMAASICRKKFVSRAWGRGQRFYSGLVKNPLRSRHVSPENPAMGIPYGC